MKRCLIALAAFAGLAAPAFADTCSSAADAATRAALASSEAAGRRTSVVRIDCGGTRQTFVLHQIGSGAGASVLVRELKKSETPAAAPLFSKRDFSSSSAARVIRVHK
jgi:hypothetical protein